MGKSISGVLAVGALVFTSVAAEAIPLTGAFSKTGSFIPVNATTGAPASLGTATGLDFVLTGAPNVQTPGVPGNFTVTDSEGALAAFAPVLGMGTIDDFAFSGVGTGAGVGNFPSPPVITFEFINGLTFNLTSVSVVLQDGLSLVLGGTGTFIAPGFDPTPGSFRLSGNQAGSTFSFAASQSVIGAVPEPMTLILLGGALGGVAGVSAIRRRTKRG